MNNLFLFGARHLLAKIAGAVAGVQVGINVATKKPSVADKVVAGAALVAVAGTGALALAGCENPELSDLRNENASLKDQLAGLQKDKTANEAEIKRVEDLLRINEAALAEIKDKLKTAGFADVQSAIDAAILVPTLTATKAQLEQQLAAAQASVTASAATIADLQNQITTTNADLAAANATLAQVREKLTAAGYNTQSQDALLTSITALVSQNSLLTTQLDTANTKITNMNNMLQFIDWANDTDPTTGRKIQIESDPIEELQVGDRNLLIQYAYEYYKSHTTSSSLDTLKTWAKNKLQQIYRDNFSTSVIISKAEVNPNKRQYNKIQNRKAKAIGHAGVPGTILGLG